MIHRFDSRYACLMALNAITSFQAWSRKRPSPGSGSATANGLLFKRLVSRPDKNRVLSLRRRIWAKITVSGWVASLPVRETKGLAMLLTLTGLGLPRRTRRRIERFSRWPPCTPARTSDWRTTLGSNSGEAVVLIGLSAMVTLSTWRSYMYTPPFTLICWPVM